MQRENQLLIIGALLIILINCQHQVIMVLTPENYTSLLSKDLIKSAQKCTVRESDEIEKGHFIAYVDESEESFDVSIKMDAGKEVIAHTCDCKNSSKFCKHTTALLVHIAKKIVRSIPVKKNKIAKASPSETLLESIELPDLQIWLRDLLAKNKDTELAFIHYFSTKNYVYTQEEVTKITKDAIKAVVKNKKNIDPTELKKIIDLWGKVHKPIVDYYQANMGDEKSFLNFHCIIEDCLKFYESVNIKSNKIPKYIEGLLVGSAQHINNLYDEDTWLKSVNLFCRMLPNQDDSIRLHYLLHLKNIFNISNEERKRTLLQLVVNQYKVCKDEHRLNGDSYSKVLYEMVEQLGTFSDHYDIFRPLHFDNEFNLKFIRGLMDIGNLDRAVEYSEEQIRKNFREEYNLPYLLLLKEIFQIKNDPRNLARILEALFPFTFSYEDFIFISNRLSGENEKKEWRHKMFTKARNVARTHNNRAIDFCFMLLDAEKNYKKMIQLIDSFTPYPTILKYFEAMVTADSALLLDGIVNKTEIRRWGFVDTAEDIACFEALYRELIKYYQPAYLQKVVLANEGQHRYNLNKFMVYLQQHLAGKLV